MKIVVRLPFEITTSCTHCIGPGETRTPTYSAQVLDHNGRVLQLYGELTRSYRTELEAVKAAKRELRAYVKRCNEV